MAKKDIVVIGASAGGVEAMIKLAAALPERFAASIFLVIHTSPQSPGLLAEILDRSGPLPALTPRDGERIEPGRIYVAPPDRHLLLEPGRVRLTRGPRENRFRPAIDPLFRSAAQVYGPRVVGVILTGGLDDGASGLWAVKQLGGTAIVQDPEDALVNSMPLAAIERVRADHILPLAEIAPALARLTSESTEEKGVPQVPEELEIEVKIAKEDSAIEAGVVKLGAPSIYACPECHGVLLQMKEGNTVRFRCHTGHAYTPNSLVAEITEAVEDALWNAIRSIQESVMLLRQLGEHMRGHGDEKAAASFLRMADDAERRVDLVRQAALQHENVGGNAMAETPKP